MFKSYLNTPWYKGLKWFVMIVMPAVIALYATLGDIWDIPYVLETVATMSAFTTALGAILGISSKNYYDSGVRYDGDMNVEETSGGGMTYDMELNHPAEDLKNQDEVIFKIKR